MQYSQLERFRDWFEGYVSGFYGDDDYINANLKLKEDHTARVCREMKYLAGELGLNENEGLIAETIALFHDLGRFPQFVKYQTFCDHRSVNHCCLSLDALKESEILDILEENEKQIIETAIIFHGIKKLPSGLEPQTELFAELIRDADKVDVYQVFIDFHEAYAANPGNILFEIEFPDDPFCSEEVLKAVINGELIDYALLRTLNDMRLLLLGWVYDVNFIPTFKRIKERDYLERICGFFTCKAHVERVKTVVLDYVDSRIKNS